MTSDTPAPGGSHLAEHNLTTRLLSQFSGARVDPYASFVAYLMCQEFQLSVQGQRSMNTALNNLPVYFTADEDLAFGWGTDYLMRNEEVHRSRYEHLSLCAALSESFPETYVAQILAEMAKQSDLDLDILPHVWQWKTLAHATNGILASIDFATTVEDYMRLQEGQGRPMSLGKAAAPPESVARALKALEHLTSGREKQMTVVGGDIAAWFAALAQWLFGLRISIFSGDGKQLYASQTDQEAQLTIMFDSDSSDDLGIKSLAIGSVYRLTATDTLAPSTLTDVHVSGRVIWNSLLPRVFGQSFHRLDHEEAKTLGTAIGAAARSLQGLAENKYAQLPTDLISAQNKHNPASFGAGLVQTITTWMPELRRFQGRMERALKMTFEEAIDAAMDQNKRFEKLCHCDICTCTETTHNDEAPQGPTQGYCLPVMVDTIIALGLSLSRMTVSAQIYPSRAGIQAFYASQVEKRLQTKRLDQHDSQRFAVVFGSEWNASDARRLQNCAMLFSGSRPSTDIPENLVAVAHEGICAYLQKMEKPEGKAGAEGVNIIRIVSGGINVKQKVFSRACLGPVTGPEQDGLWEMVECEHLSLPLYCK